MRSIRIIPRSQGLTASLLLAAFASLAVLTPVRASGGGSATVAKVDTIKVAKCYYDRPSGQMLIKASSSDPGAVLKAYRPDGTLQGAVQNGGGSRYGGTVMGWIPSDPGTMTIRSSSGGSIVVPTTPFQI